MAKSKLKNKNLALALIFLVAIAVLIIKAYVRLPINNNGVSADGLYFYLNETQFVETFIATLIAVGFFCYKVIKTNKLISTLMAIGFSFLNLGIMIFDSRFQKHNVIVEIYIRQNYGSTAWLYMLSFIAITIGLVIIYFSRKKM